MAWSHRHGPGLKRMGALFGPALLVVACGPSMIMGDAGTGNESPSSETGDPGSEGDGTTETGCGVVRLADVGRGIGGFVLDGEAAHNWAGHSVSGAGDVNGDGLDDVIVGAPWANTYCPEPGRAYVVFGKVDTDPMSLADVGEGVGGFALDGMTQRDYTGWSVSGAGDVNGDDLADVVVGAPNADANGYSSGRTYVVFGKADTGAVSLVRVTYGVGGFVLGGEAEADRSGWSASGTGDINGDGLADIVVGAPNAAADGVTDSGRTYVVFGKADTEQVALSDVAQGVGGFVLDGEAEPHHSGGSVSGVGDMNGDGLADMVVGAYGPDQLGTHDLGRIYVVFGKANTRAVSLSELALGVGGFAVECEVAGDLAGTSVSGAGDVNGDGRSDILVGAPWTSLNGIRAGGAYVVFGKPDTDRVLLSDVAQGIGGFALNGEAEDDEAGVAVGGAGDVNGDGRADVIVGAHLADANGTSSGRTYVVFGKADTDRVLLSDVARGRGGFVLDGEGEEDESGRSVSRAGDVNADGLADIVVGAPSVGSNRFPRIGRAYVVFGADFSCE